MTIKELIGQLEFYDMDLEVRVSTIGSTQYREIDVVIDDETVEPGAVVIIDKVIE